MNSDFGGSTFILHGSCDLVNMRMLGVLFLLSLFRATSASMGCPITICSDELLPIRFPFILEGHQPPDCGYPGFNLTCSKDMVTVLNLPYSAKFNVRDIAYGAQVIVLDDPGECMANRRQNLNLSGSPFKALHYRNYTFLSCPPQLVESLENSIACLSNSTHSILATSSISLAKSMTPRCRIMYEKLLPVEEPRNHYRDDFTSELDMELPLTWDIPNCKRCERQGGMCGLLSRTGPEPELGCFFDDQSGNSEQGLRAFRLIIVGIAGPAMLCAIALSCIICFATRRVDNNAQQIAAIPYTHEEQRGLDQATIESYKEIALGESKRLPGPNGNICPICLSEYKSKEMIRCIPTCEHCFHTECIDEWLQKHGSCPVCRNSPSHTNND